MSNDLETMKSSLSGKTRVFLMSKIFGTMVCITDKAFSRSERLDSEEMDCETIIKLGAFSDIHLTTFLLCFIQLPRTFFPDRVLGSHNRYGPI